MPTMAQLQRQLADLKAEGTALLDKVTAESRDFTDAEEARYAEIEAKLDDVEAQIAERRKLDERRRRLDAAEPERVPAGQRVVNDLNPATTGGFKSLGEFAVAVHGAVQAGRIGGTIDERLVAATPSGTHQGGGDAGEGYLLPPQYRTEVWELMEQFDEFGPLIDEEPTSAREVKLYADEATPWGTSGIKAYWRAEGSQMTPTELSQEPRSVPLHQLYTMALATDELLEDAPRLNNRLGRKAAEAIAYKKNLAIVEGNGVGQPLGWFTSNALVTVAKESAQAADTIVAANVLKMFSRLKTIPGDRPFWMVNEDCTEQLATMTIGDRPIWLPPNGLADAPGGFLLGRPVRFSEFAQTLGDKGDIQLVSPRGYYGARRSSGIEAASSIHLYFDYGVQAFRWTFRYGGQPHLSTPVAPKNGTATRSHFVTLAAR